MQNMDNKEGQGGPTMTMTITQQGLDTMVSFLYTFLYTYYSNIYVQVIYVMMMKNRPNVGQIVPQGLETC